MMKNYFGLGGVWPMEAASPVPPAFPGPGPAPRPQPVRCGWFLWGGGITPGQSSRTC